MKRNIVLAVFGLVLFAVSAFHFHMNPLMALMSVGLVGVTVTYLWPTTNGVQPGGSALGTNPPTATQVNTRVNVQLQMGDTDTQAVITHNLNVAVAQQAQGFPIIDEFLLALQGTGGNPILTWSLGTNTVTAFKASAAGSNFTALLSINLPHSITK